MIETVGIIGTGNVGGAFGERLVEVGYTVRFGVREGSDVSALLARCGERASATSVVEASKADAVLLAVPGMAVREAVQGMGDLSGRIVIDATNPVGAGISLASPPEGSNAGIVAALAPKARVVKAFNVFGAEFHRHPTIDGVPVDVPVATDDAEAKRDVIALAERAGFRPLDLGGLRNAVVLEAMAIAWIHLAMKGGHGRQVAWKLLSNDRG